MVASAEVIMIKFFDTVHLASHSLVKGFIENFVEAFSTNTDPDKVALDIVIY